MQEREDGITHSKWQALRKPETVAQSETNILAALEEHGNRVTWPRRTIAATLSRRSDSFSVEDIAAETPRLGRATVYRTIRLLVKVGILCKTVLPSGSPRYSLDDALHHHHHLVCVSCGRIDEFRHPAVERVIRAMRHEFARELTGHRLDLYHCCDACQAGEQGVDARMHGHDLW
ncbi:MAG: transcriptional repressor [Chloroflexi bacterium]|nr:transcriptional repressor [Chloroflexota bacterium]